MKKFILGLLILSTLLSLAIICNATLIADQLIDIPAEEEIMPMSSNWCSGPGTYIPSSWTTNDSYKGYTMEYVIYMNGWELNSNNEIIYDKAIIGRYDRSHFMDNKWTVSHFHIYSDLETYGNIHYIL